MIILLGSPGAGKGTQAELLKDRFNLPKISTGDMLRAEVARNSELGRQIASQMDEGGLVGDDLINHVIASRIQLPDCIRGFILDGYPRSAGQAEHLVDLLRSDDQTVVIEIAATCEELLPRFAARRYCPKCSSVFSLDPQDNAAAACTKCGTLLQQRSDDREGVIRTRFREYQDVTRPIVAHYRRLGVFRQVPATLPVSEVFHRIETIVAELFRLQASHGAVAVADNFAPPRR